MNMKDVSMLITVLFVGGCAINTHTWWLAIILCIWLVHEAWEYTTDKENYP